MNFLDFFYKKKYHYIKLLITSFLSIAFIKTFLKTVLFVKKEQRPYSFFARCFLYTTLLLSSLNLFKNINFEVKPQGSLEGTNFIIQSVVKIHFFINQIGSFLLSSFGDGIKDFGGIFFQGLIPIYFISLFLKQKKTFLAFISLWWFGHGFLDIAPYIYRIRNRQIWNPFTKHSLENKNGYESLNQIQFLDKYSEMAYFIDHAGKFFLFLSFLWGILLLYKQFSNYNITNKKLYFL